MPPVACQISVLKKRSEFLAVAAHRQKWVTPAFILQVAPRPKESKEEGGAPVPAPMVGYGLTASKKMIGKAVQRNRARRRLRALAVGVLPSCARTDMNYVFIARGDILTISFDVLRRDLEKALKRMKIWVGEGA